MAGTDRVAIDAVGVAILRHFGTTAEVSRGSVFEQEQIARALALGLGACRVALLTGRVDLRRGVGGLLLKGRNASPTTGPLG